ncbi:MAG: hypothetical protein AAFY88_27705 [Acidobacteriota bacterium]
MESVDRARGRYDADRGARRAWCGPHEVDVNKELMMRTAQVIFGLMLAFGMIGCGPATDAPPADAPSATAPADSAAPEVAAGEASPQDEFWGHLTELCGQAFAGAMSSSDKVDAEMADQPMVMHVRRCDEDRLEIPFHIGENRSRTWVLTRTADGLKLQHDHRHEDGTSYVVTLYGGSTAEAGLSTVQLFPVDEYSKELFVANGLEASVTNVWAFEIDPGQRFSYILRRPERHFQADFDLTAASSKPHGAGGSGTAAVRSKSAWKWRSGRRRM